MSHVQLERTMVMVNIIITMVLEAIKVVVVTRIQIYLVYLDIDANPTTSKDISSIGYGDHGNVQGIVIVVVMKQ